MTAPTTAPLTMQDVVQACTPEGYEIFYSLIFDRVAPRHVMEWIRAIFTAWKENKPVLLKAFRGSTKTTATVTLWAYLHGCKPDKTGLIVQVKDESAQRNASWIADTIENNKAWKLCFPDVVPDKERGWGDDKGYFLKRTSVDYGDWVRTASSKDPTFIGYGYASTGIVGLHPSLYLGVDDIIDEEIASSAREMQNVKNKWSSVISYTRQPNNPLTVVSHTPWTDDDVYNDMAATGEFFSLFTPGRQEDGTPTWPEGFPDEAIGKAEREDITGGVDFSRMVMLDLTRRANRVFQYQTYPAHLIMPTWPTGGGIDYAGVQNPLKRTPDHSHFGLAYVAQTPENRAVIVDGVLERCSQAESERYVIRAQGMFPMWQWSVCEGDGKGEEFIQLLSRHPDLKIYQNMTHGVNKVERLVRILGPWLANGKVMISDGDTKFLRALRNFFNKYPAVGEHDPGWDAADATFWALTGFPQILTMPRFTLSNTGAMISTAGGFGASTPAANPWASLGAAR